MRSARRLDFLLWAVMVELVGVMLIARRMWLADPIFAPLPAFGNLGIGPPLDCIAHAALLGLLLPIPFVPRWRRQLIVAFCVLLLLRGAWDQVAWQPWLLQHTFMLLTLAFVPRDGGDGEVERGVLDVNRLVLVLVYFLSGIAKLHHRFLEGSESLVVKPFAEFLGLDSGPIVSATFAGLETLLALGLLHPRSRRLSVLGLVAMHAMILTFLGPWWHHHNPAVWPWNVAMIGALFALFWRDGTRTSAILWPRPRGLRVAALLLFLVLPLASYVGAWPVYLSFRLYAMRTPEAAILLTQDDLGAVPADARPFLSEYGRVPGFTHAIELSGWCESRLGVYAAPRTRAFVQMAHRYVQTTRTPVMLFVLSVPDWWTGDRKATALRFALTPR